MRIIVVGSGKMGSYLSRVLAKENHDVIVIDQNETVLTRLESMQDVSIVCGNSLVIDTLEEADAKNTDLLIATMEKDEDNILCCLLAKKMGTKNTIARVRNPEYSKSINYIKDNLGLSMAINPELLTAKEIAGMLRFPSTIKPYYLAKGKLELLEFKIKENSFLIGSFVKELRKKINNEILIVAVERESEVYIPNGSFVFQEGDKVIITAKSKNITNFFKQIGMDYLKIKKTMIIGGSKVSYYLAKFLSELNLKVKLVEMDPKKCELLSEQLPKTLVLNGDGSDRHFLLEAGIETMDALVAATGIDEENVVFSMFANSLQIPKVITKINRLDFREILEKVGVESILTPHVIATDHILRYIRAKENSKGGSMEFLIRLIEDQVEIMEFVINKEFKKIGKTLKEIKFKEDLLIVCINRKGNLIFPTGEDTIEVEDDIIIATTKSGIKGFNDILG